MVSLQPETVSYLASLPTSELTRVLSLMDQSRQIAALLALRNQPRQFDQASKDIQRKRDERSEAARVWIPEIADIKRREACLEDPELFLRTYFSAIFYNPFASHHKAMIQAIYDRCYTGGDKAVAAPRGDGKSQVTIGMMAYALLATPIRFPIFIAQTTKKSSKLFKQLKNKFNNPRKFPEFFGDFPEITACVNALDGAPQRAPKQHVNGVKTDILWT